MRERDWLVSAIDGCPDFDNPSRRVNSEQHSSDLSAIIELTRRRIDEAFDQSTKVKGKYRDKEPEPSL